MIAECKVGGAQATVFLISLKAGGTGLNMTAIDFVIQMAPLWNPAVEDQANRRLQRIGQTRNVLVYRVIARGTINKRILSLHEEKRGAKGRNSVWHGSRRFYVNGRTC